MAGPVRHSLSVRSGTRAPGGPCSRADTSHLSFVPSEDSCHRSRGMIAGHRPPDSLEPILKNQDSFTKRIHSAVCIDGPVCGRQPTLCIHKTVAVCERDPCVSTTVQDGRSFPLQTLQSSDQYIHGLVGGAPAGTYAYHGLAVVEILP